MGNKKSNQKEHSSSDSDGHEIGKKSHNELKASGSEKISIKLVLLGAGFVTTLLFQCLTI
jgi:hypothetical protein